MPQNDRTLQGEQNHIKFWNALKVFEKFLHLPWFKKIWQTRNRRELSQFDEGHASKKGKQTQRSLYEWRGIECFLSKTGNGKDVIYWTFSWEDRQCKKARKINKNNVEIEKNM